jgi:hypothetical protein
MGERYQVQLSDTARTDLDRLVWTRNPFYEGTSTQDMFARMQKDALWKPRYERLKGPMTKTPEPT